MMSCTSAKYFGQEGTIIKRRFMVFADATQPPGPRRMLISAIRAEILDLLTKRQYRTPLTDLRRIIREGKQELVNKGFAKVV